jgi:hypothetical protein
MWGNYCAHDGLFWRRGASLSTPLEVCRRTIADLSDGGVVDHCFAVDAGASYAPQNGNIYEIRFAWLGVHEVDWYLNGRLLRSDNFDGRLPKVYMSTGTLPLRAEASGAATMKYVCSNVTSEGGQAPPLPGFSYARTAAKTVGQNDGIVPIIALRPVSSITSGGFVSHAHVELIPTSISCTVDGTPNNVRVYSYLNQTLTGATWAIAPSQSFAEVDVAATAASGGIQACVFTASEGTHELHHVFGVNQRALRVRALGQPVDTLTVAVDSTSGNQTVACAIEWQEVR